MATGKQMEAFDDLAARSIVNIFGNIDDRMVEHVHNCLAIAETSLRSGGIELRIQSNGGRVNCGLAIYDMVLASPLGCTQGVVTGRADSMAAIILQACDERVIMRHASILIHCLTRHDVSLATLRNPRKLKKLIEECEREQGRMDSILAKRTGKSIRQIRRRLEQDRPMSAEEAVAFGLADSAHDSYKDFPVPY